MAVGGSIARGRRACALAAGVLCWCASGCSGTPSEPRDTMLAGRWSGDGACLAVTDQECNLTVGCGHGQFPRPIIRADGTFDVDGTYRIEVGPIAIEPAPPAHFSGVVTGSRLTLNVRPSGSLPSASYSTTSTTAGTCP